MDRVGKFELLARLGFASRGLMYLAIGYLALRLGRTEDSSGVLRYLGGGGGEGGRWLLAAMALGFLGYALWRLAEAWTDTEGHGSDAKGIATRIGGAVSGILHIGLGFAAARLASGSGDGRSDATRDGAGAALDLPGGWLLLVAAAVLLFAVGGYQLFKAQSGGFLRHLEAGAAGRPWVRWAGRIGYAARGLVFLVMAWLAWRAGMEERQSEAGGIGAALESLPPALQTLGALGLLLFGLFSLVEARYRRIGDTDVLRRLGRGDWAPSRG